MMLKFHTQVASPHFPQDISIHSTDILGIARASLNDGKLGSELLLRGGVRIVLSDDYDEARRAIEDAKKREQQRDRRAIENQITAPARTEPAGKEPPGCPTPGACSCPETEANSKPPIRECACGQPWRPAVGLYGTTEETECQACTLRRVLRRKEAQDGSDRGYQVLTLCGSARFEPWFHLWNKILSMAGHVVFTLTAWPSVEGEKLWYTDEQKKALDQIHFKKIEQSDAIVVLNLHAYIGPSTMNEIRHAERLGKSIYFLESWGEGCGIGADHFQHVQDHAYGLLKQHNYRSPIDTFARAGTGRREVIDLLGKAGPLRSSLVKMMHSLDPGRAKQAK